MHNKTRSRRASAQGLVEFALIMPLLLAILMGIIDFGWLVFNYTALYNGMREGLRYGSVPTFSDTAPDQFRDCDGIRAHIVSLASSSGIKASDITIYYDHGYSTGSSDNTHNLGYCPIGSTSTVALSNGDRIVIQISTNVRLLTPFFGVWARNGLNFQFRAARTIYPDGIVV